MATQLYLIPGRCSCGNSKFAKDSAARANALAKCTRCGRSQMTDSIAKKTVDKIVADVFKRLK